MIARLAMAMLAMALAAGAPQPAAAATVERCNWWPTGQRPYTGTVRAALARMPGIPADQVEALAARIAMGDADEWVSITRHHIAGAQRLYGPMSHMHFGQASVCLSLDLRRWPAGHTEPASVYWVPGTQWAVLMPDVCGNPTRVAIIGSATRPAAPGAGSAPSEPAPTVLAAAGHTTARQDSPGITGPGPSFASASSASGEFEPQPLARLDAANVRAPADGGRAASGGSGPLDAPPPSTGNTDTITAPVPWAGLPSLAGGAIIVLPPAPVSPVPESPTWLLLATGLACARLATRRRP